MESRIASVMDVDRGCCLRPKSLRKIDDLLVAISSLCSSVLVARVRVAVWLLVRTTKRAISL